MKTICWLLSVGVILNLANISAAQSSLNPEISLIGDFRIILNNDTTHAHLNEKPQMVLEAVEFSIQGNLNPYARADFTLAMHKGEGIEVEEGYFTIVRGLPLGMQFKAGKYRVDFGRLNTQHSHEWSWMQMPIMISETFGVDGLSDLGLQINTLIPISDFGLKLSLNALKDGRLITGKEHIHDHVSSEHADEYIPIAPSMRMSLAGALTEHNEVEVGASYLRAQFDTEHKEYANLLAFDLKYRFMPNSYRSLTLTAEMILDNRADEHSDSDAETTIGYFAALDWQFLKRYNVGGFVDYYQFKEPHDSDQMGMGVFTGFNLMEETSRIAIVLRQDTGSEFKTYNSAMMQFLWSLGPHKPHKF